MKDLKALLIELNEVNKELERLKRGELNAEELKKAEQLGRRINKQEIHKAIENIMKEV